MNIIATSATTNIFIQNGKEFSFSLEQLENLARTSDEDIPITDDFDPRKPPLGYIESGIVIDGVLKIKGILFNDKLKSGLYLVPGCLFPECISMEYSITDKPADPSLTPIEI